MKGLVSNSRIKDARKDGMSDLATWLHERLQSVARVHHVPVNSRYPVPGRARRLASIANQLCHFVGGKSLLFEQGVRNAKDRRGVFANKLPSEFASLGPWETIEHEFDAVSGHQSQEYGDIVQIMRRKRKLRSVLLGSIHNLAIKYSN